MEQNGTEARRGVIVGVENHDDRIRSSQQGILDVMLDPQFIVSVMSDFQCSFARGATGPFTSRLKLRWNLRCWSHRWMRIGTAWTSPWPSTIGTIT